VFKRGGAQAFSIGQKFRSFPTKTAFNKKKTEYDPTVTFWKTFKSLLNIARISHKTYSIPVVL
jgi:hypothetical protein